MKITYAELERLKAAAIAKAVPAALRANGATAKAIKALHNAPADTDAAKRVADAAAAANARAILLRGRTPVPNKDDLQAATGSALPYSKLSDHDQVKAILKAQRGQR